MTTRNKGNFIHCNASLEVARFEVEESILKESEVRQPGCGKAKQLSLTTSDSLEINSMNRLRSVFSRDPCQKYYNLTRLEQFVASLAQVS